jgi:hypothetical protein
LLRLRKYKNGAKLCDRKYYIELVFQEFVLIKGAAARIDVVISKLTLADEAATYGFAQM